MAAFYLQCVPMIWQEAELKREHHFLFSGSWLYGGASLAQWHLFVLLFWWLLPLCHFMMISKIPGWLGFPIWAHCALRAIHLFHVASVAQHVEGNFPWTSCPALSVRVAESTVLQCQSLLKWLQPLHNLPRSLLQLGCNRPQILFITKSRTSGVVFKSPWVLFVRLQEGPCFPAAM